MKTNMEIVADCVAAAEEAAIKRDLNKAVSALIEGFRHLHVAMEKIDAAPVSDKPVPKKAKAKPAAKAKVAEPAAKRTAPVIKPK